MAHKRSAKKGSFGDHFDELVKHFPSEAPEPRSTSSKPPTRDLQEQRDIHALLFERAWQLHGGNDGGRHSR